MSAAGEDLQLGTEFYRQSSELALERLDTDSGQGLSSAEAARRLEKYGPNELAADKPMSLWNRFFAQFKDSLVVLLLIATAVSTGLWLYERDSALPYEAIAIFAIVLLNAGLGFVQESRAEAAVSALRRMAAHVTTVIRDGDKQRISSTDVVPGDLIAIEEGDAIAADARLISSTALHTAEAALTGESLPVAKDTAEIAEEAGLGDRLNMVFSGTVATYGRGLAVVTATGMQTEMGKIADLLQSTKEESTPLQVELNRVGKILGFAVVLIALVVIGTIILTGEVSSLPAFVDVLILGVALAVAAVPEGLPAIVTAVLAIGVQRMARRRAIVRHLVAVEALGSATVVASDKTGTLTKNEMTVRAVLTASGRVNFSGTGYSPVGELSVTGGGKLEGPLRDELVRALAAADRANNAVLQDCGEQWVIQGDPTEGALIVAARKAGLSQEALNARYTRIGEVPFSSDRKLMSTVHLDSDVRERVLVFSKGAPDVLISRCTRELVGAESAELSDERKAEILEQNVELAGEALRTLAVAVREIPADQFSNSRPGEELEHELAFLGIIGMIDPPRSEAKEAVKTARSAGIRPLMITGDHPKTAAVIAEELGISSEADKHRVLSGTEIERLSDKDLLEAVRRTQVYARVNPQHKLRIVKALQKDGHTVAMTGDGVNDAPALKAADIGVAMGITGTDVSKDAADIILTDDNFATILAAVEEGRGIFDNIRKFLRYLLSSNVGEVFTMFFGVVFARQIGLSAASDSGIALPLLATQILWINLVTDGGPALALGIEPATDDLMKRDPRPRGEGVITAEMWRGIVFVGLVMAAGTLFVLDRALPGGFIEGSGDLRYGQTMAFTTLTLFQLFNLFNARSDTASAFKGLFSNAWLWIATAFSLLLHAAVIYTPFLQKAFSTTALSPADWLECALVAGSVLWLRELVKLSARVVRQRSFSPA